MGLRRSLKLFDAHEGFRRFRDSFSVPEPAHLDSGSVRRLALELAQELEPRRDRSELETALADLEVAVNPDLFHDVAAVLAFLAQTLFKDISPPMAAATKKRIAEFDGPVFFFVGHSSHYDYVLLSQLLNRMGMRPPVMHVSGSIGAGWLSNWLMGMRTLKVPKNPSHIEHRAYAWFCAALAKALETQALFARTSRYTVRSRDGILREPYVPHGVVAAVKTAGKALVVPVAVSYAAIPEDRFLTTSGMFPSLAVLPRNWVLLLPYLFGLRKPDGLFRSIEGVFEDVSIDLGEPFELANNNTLTLQRISHRAIEEIARNKLIQPSHILAKAMQGQAGCSVSTLVQRVQQEIDNTMSFFRTRYRKDPPLHPLLTSDLPEAVQQGIRVLTDRGAVSRSVFRRLYGPQDGRLLQFYGYHADRRIYPLSGRNTMTVINAGTWGYTLALHIGANLLKKEQLAEHSLILYDSREDLVEKLTVEGKHPWLFRDRLVPRSVRPEVDLMAAVSDTSMVMVVTPSRYFYSMIVKVLELAQEGSDLVIATKGFIPETGLLPTQTATAEMERLGKRMKLAVLSGANLAHEVVAGGAGVTQIACEDMETFERLRTLIETPKFRVVYSRDITGTAISAALKNVYAIGFGILEGSGQAPENFLAAYSTLVTAEIRQFGLLLGAMPETFDAESQGWMADLLATCRGGRSAKFGKDLGALEDKTGKPFSARALLEQYDKKKMAVEGFEACRFAQRIAAQRGFHPPILGEIYAILHGGKKVDVDEFIEKCLDALVHRSMYPTTSAIPHLTRGR
jgi:glycerol-3-phosphate dehydrogenase (NAD(P)+)